MGWRVIMGICCFDKGREVECEQGVVESEGCEEAAREDGPFSGEVPDSVSLWTFLLVWVWVRVCYAEGVEIGCDGGGEGEGCGCESWHFGVGSRW